MRSISIAILIICYSILDGCKSDGSTETDFQIVDLSQIHYIDIESKSFGHQVLSLQDAHWWLDDTIKVRKDAIDNIFRVLPGLKIKYYPPRAAWENMMRAITSEGVKVNFKNRDERSIKCIYLGGMTNDERGTYGMVEGSRQPYVLHLPGFEGSLSSRFMMSTNQWRDRMILDYKPGDILGLKMEYPGSPESGFSIKLSSEGRPILLNHQGQSVHAVSSIVQNYLASIASIGSESIENDFEYRDTIMEQVPHAVMTLKLKGSDSTRELRFFANILEGSPDIERMFVYDGKDFYLAQIRILQKIFRPKDYFETK